MSQRVRKRMVRPVAHVGMYVLAIFFGGHAVAGAQTAFPVIKVNFASRSFETTLPFDAQFLIQGPVTPPARMVRAFYTEEGNLAPPECPFIDKVSSVPQGWHGPYRYDSVTPSANIEVKVDRALEAERTYTFFFCTTFDVSGEVLKKFQGQAVGTVDAAIAAVPVKGGITTEAAQKVRQQLCSDLQSLLAPDQVIAPGTFFNCSTTDTTQVERFRSSMADVVVPQNDLKEALDPASVNPKTVDLGNALRFVATSEDLKAIVDAFRRSKDADIRSTLERFKNGFSLIGLDAQVLTDLIAGRGRVAAVVAPATAIRDAEVAGKVSNNYRQTQLDLIALRNGLHERLERDADVDALQKSLDKQVPTELIIRLRVLKTPVDNPCIGTPNPLFCAIDSASELFNAYDRAANRIPDRAEALDRVAALIQLQTIATTLVHASTVQNDTTKTNYVSADAGFLFMPGQRAATIYIGTNIYLRPINQKATLADFGGFKRRFALLVGLTLNSIEDTEGTRFNLFNNQALVLGAGFRVTEVLRVAGGVVGFLAKDPNPFITRRNFAVTPFVSFSFDVNMAVGAKGFGDLFKGKVPGT